MMVGNLAIRLATDVPGYVRCHRVLVVGIQLQDASGKVHDVLPLQ